MAGCDDAVFLDLKLRCDAFFEKNKEVESKYEGSQSIMLGSIQPLYGFNITGELLT